MTQACSDLLSGLLIPSYSSPRPSLYRDGQHASGGQADTEFYIWWVNTIIEGRYYLTAASVVLLLDILLTFDVEVERVWKAKFTWASLLFCVNRYLPPAMYAVVLFCMNYAHLSEEFCADVFQVIPPVLIVVSEAVIGALLILRTCALYKETRSHLSHAVIGSLFFVYFAQIGLSVFVAKDLKAIGPIGQSFNEGCILFFTHSDTTRLLCLWFTNILFNVIVFMCTFKKTAKVHWMDQKIDKDFHTVHSLILVDASLYFLAVMAAKTMNLVMLVFYPQWNSINWASNHVIDVILTSHFFLHLREEGNRVMKNTCRSSVKTSCSATYTRPAILIRIGARLTVSNNGPLDCFESERSICSDSRRRAHWDSVADVERNAYIPASPAAGQLSTRLQLSVQHVIEDILEREGYADILVCSADSVPQRQECTHRGVSTRSASSRVQRKRNCRRRHSLS